MFKAIGIARHNVNARIYLIYSFLQSLWFIEAVWYFYWARFLTYSQIGIFFSFLVILGLVAEIPTGYIADKYGRKKSVVGGTILLFLGAILITSASDAVLLVAGVSVMSIGRAFISGALEAIVYDDLKSSGKHSHWDSLQSTTIQISLVAYILAVPIGGFLYNIHFRLPNILEAISMFLSVLMALKLRDTSKQHHLLERKIKVKELLVGFRELFSKRLAPYLLPAFMVISIFELYDWGLSKPAMAVSFGLDSQGQAIVYTLLAILNIVTIGLMPRLRRLMGDYWGLRILNLISGLAFVVSTYVIGMWGIGILWLLESAGNLGDPWTSSVVNENTESKYRATTLSTLAFMTRIPHFFVNILAGLALDSSGIGRFHWWLGIAIILLVLLSSISRKRPYLTGKRLSVL